jgi:hypothetical protein
MANRRRTKCPPFQFKASEQLEQEVQLAAAKLEP